MVTWTDERVELLRKLWGEGLSASKIAIQLGGVTRNAVIGKVHRLGLSNRSGNAESAQPKKANGAAKPKQTQKKVKTQNTEKIPNSVANPPTEPTAPPSRREIIPAEKIRPPQPVLNEISPETLASHREIEKKALRLSLMELTERSCKWPFGDPSTEEFWFCGLPVEPGSPYCKPCAAVAYQAASARREKRR